MSVMAEALVEPVQSVPLTAGSDGVVRVSNSRVTLDSIAEAFAEGFTAEEIVHQYPTLPLADVYAVISHILRKPSEVSAYLAARKQERGVVREENEKRFSPDGIRVRLLARESKRSSK